MASFKALCLAGVASLAVNASAHAADLLPPPPPVEMPVMPAPAIGGGWYLRGDVGEGNLQLRNGISTFSPSPNPYTTPGGAIIPQPYGFNQNYDVTPQVALGLGAGYQFNHFLRADVTGEYRFGSSYHATEGYAAGATYPGGGDYYSGSITNAVFLANGYVDLGTWCHLTPYIGAGVGVAVNQFSGVTDANIANFGQIGGAASAHSSTDLAYAFMAGLAYDIGPNLKLDVGYRYLDMGRISTGTFNCYGSCGNNSGEVQHYHLVSQDVRLGLRYSFANFVPTPQIPLIAKY